MNKYYIYTYGCQMNVHESEKLAGTLVDCGYEPCESEKEADIIVFNTCCIRENAEQHAYGNIGALKQLKKKKPSLIIAVGGCMTQQSGAGEKLKNTFPFVDIVFGTHNLEEFGRLLKERTDGKKRVIEISSCEGAVKEGAKKFRTSFPNAWVNIMYGCNNFCTYCIVPYVRGRERSRDTESIVAEVKSLVGEGYKEITLLGQNVNSYGNDLKDGSTFAALLKKVAAIEGKFRIRCMTNHPKDFNADVVDAMSSCEKICKSVHLPIQSGSDRVLKLMNRRYTSADYLKKLEYLRNVIPDCAVTTDIMVGFPTETEEDFSDTMKLVETARFSGAFTFIYSPRTGTPAATFDGQIDDETKKDRIMRLIELQNKINREQSKTYKGKTVEILAEDFDEKKGVYLGRDEFGRMAYFPSEENVIGKFVNVKIVKTGGISLIGKLSD